MKVIDKRKLLLAGCCLICITTALAETVTLDGEFSGGYLTGPLLSMNDLGTLLFVVALLCAFLFRRIAAAIAAFASALSLPLYLFFLAPIPFGNIFAPGHEFKVHHAPGIEWHLWTTIDLLTFAITLCVCYYAFLPNGTPRIAPDKPAPAGD